MKNFVEWMRNLYESDDSFPTYRGGKNKDWVSSDDYDPATPLDGGQHLKNPHRNAGYVARSQGQARIKNPHQQRTKEYADWHNGWDDHHFVHEPKNHGYGAADEGEKDNK